MAKQTIVEIVKEHEAELKPLASHKDLLVWARAHRMDNASAFARFKTALRGIGVDYDAMRSSSYAAMNVEPTHGVVLYSDAKASERRFGICDGDGHPVWFGRFFSDDREFNGEQSSGEMAAALKAVWLAGKVRERLGLPVIALRLIVDAEWLCWANRVAEGGSEGGKARKLGVAALKADVALTVCHVPSAENPADYYTTAGCGGYKRWQDNDLRALAKPVEKEVA